MQNPAVISSADLHEMFAAACRNQQNGDLASARDGYLLLLTYLPDSALVHYNLGLVYYTRQEFDQALPEFTQAAAIAPQDLDTLFNLALCQQRTGGKTTAITTYHRILAASPEHVDCLYNLAGCYRDCGNHQEARRCYLHVLELAPTYLAAANNLAYLYHRAGNFHEAQQYYELVLAGQPDNDSVRYLLAALQGTPLTEPPLAYITGFFDAYAERFEHSLVTELGYDSPQQLYTCLEQCTDQNIPARFNHGLDLGCGTGLSGIPFGQVTCRLDGVDLSARMLELAMEKGCYAKLYQDSISHHLQTTTDRYDIFIATDVFIYIGDLTDFFSGVTRCAQPAALCCFSTENLAQGSYRLQQTGRYAYAPEYVQTMAESFGWQIVQISPSRLRQERGSWLAGQLWILRLS